MPTNSKISIIIAIYNAEEYLEKCLDSCIYQTYKNIEVIAVNDGSPDNSYEIALAKSKSDSRILLINQENKGLVRTRKVGFGKSSGEYIFFLDCDDYLEPNAIELLYNSMIKDDGDIVVGACVYENEFGERITEWNSYLLGTSQADYLKSMFRLQLQLNIWGRLIRREIFDVVNIPDHFFGGEDIIANTMMICYNKNLKIRTIDNCIYHYLVRKESLTNSISPSEFMDYTVEVEKILIETNFEELVMKEWAYYMIVSAWRKYLRKGGRRFLKDKVFVKNLYGKYFDLIKQDLDFFERFELFLFKLNPTIARLVSRTLFKLSVLK